MLEQVESLTKPVKLQSVERWCNCQVSSLDYNLSFESLGERS
jgi:hypothetical protein